MRLYVNIYLAGFLITLSPNGPFVWNSFFRPKTILKVGIIKTKSATMACFSSPPFLLLALSFSPFLFLNSLLFVRLFLKNRLDIPSQFPSQSHLRNGLSSLTCIVFFYFFSYFKVPRLKGPRNFLI